MINNYQAPNQWVKVLRHLQNVETYEQFCSQGPKQAKQFCDIDLSIKQMREILFSAIKKRAIHETDGAVNA